MVQYLQFSVSSLDDGKEPDLQGRICSGEEEHKIGREQERMPSLPCVLPSASMSFGNLESTIPWQLGSALTICKKPCWKEAVVSQDLRRPGISDSYFSKV